MNGEIVMILVRVPPEDRQGITAETLWAERVGTDRFRLGNTPFWVRDLSYRDIVFARVRRGLLTYAGVSLRGGHSTCWMVLRVERTDEAFVARWARLHDLGCRYEGDGRRTLAIDVPPEASFDLVERLLEAGADDGVWDYEVAHRSHPVVAREPVAP
jgi:uncharacterized protein DUF4265